MGRQQTDLDPSSGDNSFANGTHRGGRRWLALVVGVGFGAAIAPQFWPLVQRWVAAGDADVQTRVESNAVSVPLPPVSSNPALASLGTDSSLSAKPVPFVLVGTIPGRVPSEGKAMIGIDERNAQTYVAGAALQNGAVVAEIYRERVILERLGRRATLYLTGYGRSQISSDLEVTALLATAPASSPPAYVPPESVPVTDYIRFVPKYRDDVVMGITVYPGARAGTFTKWGLMSGDVLTSIDGAIPVDPDDVNAWLSRLTEGASLSARVDRNGKTLSVSLNGADILANAPVRTANANGAPQPP